IHQREDEAALPDGRSGLLHVNYGRLGKGTTDPWPVDALIEEFGFPPDADRLRCVSVRSACSLVDTLTSDGATEIPVWASLDGDALERQVQASTSAVTSNSVDSVRRRGSRSDGRSPRMP